MARHHPRRVFRSLVALLLLAWLAPTTVLGEAGLLDDPVALDSEMLLAAGGADRQLLAIEDTQLAIEDTQPPRVNGVSVSSPAWVVDGVNTYLITAAASEQEGESGIDMLRVLINHQGANREFRRGYLAWRADGHTWGAANSTDRMACNGGGYAEKYNGTAGEPIGYGRDYLDLIACQTSLNRRGVRQVIFVVQPRRNFGSLDHNDISLWARDSAGNRTGWVNHDLNFASTGPNLPIRFRQPAVAEIQPYQDHDIGLVDADGLGRLMALELPSGARDLSVLGTSGPIMFDLASESSLSETPAFSGIVEVDLAETAAYTPNPDGTYPFEAVVGFIHGDQPYQFSVVGTASKAGSTSCANRAGLDQPRYFQGDLDMPIYTSNAPAGVVTGLNNATSGAQGWNNACPNSGHIPTASVNSGSRPGNYRDAIQIVYMQGQDPNGAATATYRTGPNQNTITVYERNPQGNVVNWASNSGRDILMHEIGHALGLSHDSCQSNSVMQPELNTATSHRILPVHCDVADAENCDPNIGPCPDGGAGFALAAEVVGLPQGQQTRMQLEVTEMDSSGQPVRTFRTRNETFTTNGTNEFHKSGKVVQVRTGWAYTIRSHTLPPAQHNCELINQGGGTVSNQGEVVLVRCGTFQFPIGGQISQLLANEEVRIVTQISDPQNPGGITRNTSTFNANGGFQLKNGAGQVIEYENGTIYFVESATVVNGRNCGIQNSGGEVNGAPISDIQISCPCSAPPSPAKGSACAQTYNVGGTIQGLMGGQISVTGRFFHPNGAGAGFFEETKNGLGNGGFQFSGIEDGWHFSISLDNEPPMTRCFLFSPVFEVNGANVNSIRINCFEVPEEFEEDLGPDFPPPEEGGVCDPFWDNCDDELCFTDCRNVPPECFDLDGDGIKETCGDEQLECTDMCTGGGGFRRKNAGSTFFLDTPFSSFTIPNAQTPINGQMPLEGWATDPDDIGGVLFFIDNRLVEPDGYQYGLHVPEACAALSAIGVGYCDPNSGFAGSIDVSGLQGSHTLQMIAMDDHRNYTRMTLVQIPIQVTNVPGLELIRVTHGATEIPHLNQPAFDFGTFDIGDCQGATGCVGKNFVIHNDRASAITVGNFTKPAGFAFIETASGIGSGGSDNFSIRLTGNSTGTFSGQVSFEIVSDPAPRPVYRMNVIGRVTGQANQPPNAANDSAQTDKNTAVVINVTANDSDPDGDPVTLTSNPIVTGPSNGSAVKVSSSSIRYTPNSGYVGSDSFVYRVTDGQGHNDTASVSITVNDVPPGAPTNVSASDALFDYVEITWTPPADAEHYEVYRNTANSAAGRQLIADSASYPVNFTTSSYVDYEAQGGVTFWYWVIAKNDLGRSDYSNSDSGSAVTNPTPDLVLENVSLSSTSLFPNEFFTSHMEIRNLNASTLPNDIFYVRTYYSVDGTLSGDDESIALFLLAPPYDNPEPLNHSGRVPTEATAGSRFILIQVDSEADIAETNEGNNVAAIPIEVLQPTPPSTVPNFVGRIDGQNVNGLIVHDRNPAVDFTWNHASDASGIERYQVVLQPVGGPWMHSPHIFHPSTSTTIQTSDLVYGTSYSIHIRAKNNAGLWGSFINGGTFTVEEPVPSTVPGFIGRIGGQNISGLTVYDTTPQVVFTWNHASDTTGIERYQIVLQPTDGSGWLYSPHVVYPGTSHTINTSGLIFGKSYSIHIRAKNNFGNWGPFVTGGQFSVEQPGAPSAVPNFLGRIGGTNINGLTVHVTDPQITFTWGHASHSLGIERYHIVVQATDGSSGWLFGPNILYPGTSNTLQTSGLIYGKDYSIHIRAKSVDGQWGPFVNGGAFEVREPIPPLVTGFIARYNGSNVDNGTVPTTGPQLDFSWNLVSDPSGVERYHIVVQAADGSSGWLYGPNILHPGDSHSLQTSGLLNGQTYSYHIRAKNNLGNWGPFIRGGEFTVNLP